MAMNETQIQPDNSFDPYGTVINGHESDPWSGVRDPDKVNFAAETDISPEVPASPEVPLALGRTALVDVAPKRDRVALRRPLAGDQYRGR